MQVVILAGGKGLRITEESVNKPKPMVEIGGAPLLFHIMRYYAWYGHKEFIICGGYKQEVIQEYFKEQKSNFLRSLDIAVIDTGWGTMTGGRIKRIEKYIKEDTFLCTYGDGLSTVDLNKLIQLHSNDNNVATLSAVIPPKRFGVVKLLGKKVQSFNEKSADEKVWINGGFFAMNRRIFEYIGDDNYVLEQDIFPVLASQKLLGAYKHTGFWQCMDTIHDKNILEELWNKHEAPWEVWNE